MFVLYILQNSALNNSFIYVEDSLPYTISGS
jgi:hypothetical protein